MIRMDYDWKATAQPHQLPPRGDSWHLWLFDGGRVAGTTRAGNEWVRDYVKNNPGCRIILVGRNPVHVRETIVEGGSGIINITPPNEAPSIEYARRRLVWPNGSEAFLANSEEIEHLRGLQAHAVFWNDPAPHQVDVFDMVTLVARLGESPKVVITGRLNRPGPLFDVLNDHLKHAPDSNRLTMGTVYDIEDYLDPNYIKTLKQVGIL